MKVLYLCLHGLNNNHQIWDHLKNSLGEDCEVWTPCLSGHRGLEGMRNLVLRDWLLDMDDICREFTEKKEQFDKVHLIGFSLGALLIFLYREQLKHKDLKISFYAPAIMYTFGTKLLIPLTAYGGRPLIPSLMPVEYRVHPGTSLNAYKALFSLSKRARMERDFSDVIYNVFLDPKDEAISFLDTRNFFTKEVKNSEIVDVGRDRLPHHQLIDLFKDDEFIKSYIKISS